MANEIKDAMLRSEDMTKFLDFEKSKVQILTLDQLRETKREKNSRGEPMMGIFHYALLDNIIGQCNDHHFDVEVYDLFAAHNRDRYCPGVSVYEEDEKLYGEHAVKATALRRVYANIRIKDFDDEENTTCLAVAFHQRGIQIGFGNNVKICHNLCMLGADSYASTYSDRGHAGEGHSIPKLLETVGKWLDNAESHVMADRAKLERMNQIEVSREHLMTIFGLLVSRRVMADAPSGSTIRVNNTYPLNNAQINDFALDMLERINERRVSVYDLYDAATNLYKATSMDIPALLPQNRSMVSFLETEFAL